MILPQEIIRAKRDGETLSAGEIGDFIGDFKPGNLVLTGPNLPHNWISDLARDEVVRQRSIVVQFSAGFIQGCMQVIPELRTVEALLRRAAHGIEPVAKIGKMPDVLEQTRWVLASCSLCGRAPHREQRDALVARPVVDAVCILRKRRAHTRIGTMTT